MAVDNEQFTISDHFSHLKKTKDSTGACFWDLGNLIDLLIRGPRDYLDVLLPDIFGKFFPIRNFKK